MGASFSKGGPRAAVSNRPYFFIKSIPSICRTARRIKEAELFLEGSLEAKIFPFFESKTQIWLWRPRPVLASPDTRSRISSRASKRDKFVFFHCEAEGSRKVCHKRCWSTS